MAVITETPPANAVQVKKPWIKTPLVESAALSKAAGCRIFLKLDNLQPSGSFKSRGIGNYMIRRLQTHPDPLNLHFFSSSGGNAGLACVHAANDLNHKATIVVPESTKPLMISKLRTAGAHDVVQVGKSWQEADAYLRETFLHDPNAVYVPPFDHEDIWEGNATAVEEVAAQLEGLGVEDGKPDAIVCSVGGGGLLNGLVQGIDEAGWGVSRSGTDRVNIVAVETDGADSLNKSIKARELITLPGITSQATSLGAVRVAAKAFDNGLRKNVKSVVLPDSEAAMGCWRLADDEKLIVELACGVSVALCYNGELERAVGKQLTKDSVVVIIVCGGSNVTVEMLAKWREEYGAVEKKVSNGQGVPSSYTAPVTAI